MSVSREDQGNQNSVVGADEPAQEQLIEVGEVSGTKGGAVGGFPDIGAGYTYG